MAQNKRRKMNLGAACSSVGGSEPHNAQQTAVAKNEEKLIFNANLSEFREAVKWTGFVDRSEFIQELLSKTDTRIVIIFAPKRFGKSMNVSMVQRFLEIERGRKFIDAPKDLQELENFENFKAFNRYELKKPCKILAEEDLVKEHFGRHPVVYLNFKDVKVDSIQDVKYCVKQVVHRAYEEHSYLKTSKIFSDGKANQDANEYCEDWCHSRKYKNEDATQGLQNLIRYLHEYHKRKVYLLVDEFDAPAVNALLDKKSGDEVTKISNQVTELLGAVVKGPVAEQHLLGSLITGVSYLGSVGISQHLNNVSVYKWLLDYEGRFAPYYGLSDEELTTLLIEVFPSEVEKRESIQEEVKDLYNGYNFQNKSIYCLWSVLHYIKQRSTMDASEIAKKTKFWGGSSIISKLGSVLKNNSILNEIIELLNVKDEACNISFKPCEKVDAQDLTTLLNLSFEQNKPRVSSATVFSFLMEQGYLTPVQRETTAAVDCSKPDLICVKIPNVDVLSGFQEMFRNFYIQVHGFDDTKMNKCAIVFNNLPRDKNCTIFKQKLKEFYENLRLLFQKFEEIKDVNERSLQGVLYTTMLEAPFDRSPVEKLVKKGTIYGRIDHLWVCKSFVGIVEEKVIKSDDADRGKKAARQALTEILTGGKKKRVPYVEILKEKEFRDIKNYFLIGMCMSDKGKLYMCCLVNSQKLKDCITFG